MKVYNKVQIFGLQRSGTNFIEWTLNNNFIDANYKRFTEHHKIVKGNYQGLARFNQYQSIKHTRPTLKFSDYIIAIYKPLDQWLESIIKSNHCLDIELSKKSYNIWHQDLVNIPKEKKIVYSHKQFYDRYDIILNEIASKFEITLNNNITYPKYRLDKNCKLTNQEYG